VEETAHLSGFSEASAFIRAFRRWTGTTPHSYRRQPPT
jgi:AraC-like DNA-binding protein